VAEIRRRSRWLLFATLATIAVLALSYTIWLSALGRYLIRDEPSGPADAAVVLAGDFTGSGILTAAELLRQGLVPKILVSGPGSEYGLHESDLAIPFAVRKGYPQSYFLPLPNESRSTAQEAQCVIPELRKLGAHRVDVVTRNFHTRRAGRIYRSQAPDMEFHFIAARGYSFDPDHWWKDREQRKEFLMEWLKTVASWVGM
jgi:uncharacterized SAM-binding protein YcdF (DUF218 family)